MQIKKEMLAEVSKSLDFLRPIHAGDLNIVCLVCSREGEPVSRTNERTQAVYQKLMGSLKPTFTISKTTLDLERYSKLTTETVLNWNGIWDDETKGLVVLRLCLMNPFTNSREMKNNFVQEVIALLSSESQARQII